MRYVCKTCGKKRKITEFNKIIKDGPLEPWNLRRCKKCTHEEYRKRYANPSKRLVQLAASRSWKERNLNRHAELAHEYRQRNKEKIRAQNALNYAVRTGRIARGSCEKCGTDNRVHGHHDDYNQPLQVRWLCFECHKLEHG